MKAMISRVFSRIGSAAGSTNSVVSSGLCTGDIESYYANIVVECLRRMLVPRDSIDVRIKRLGKGPDGLAGFAGYVRILKWDPVVTPLLLQNLPVIDARVQKLSRTRLFWRALTTPVFGSRQAAALRARPKF
jgi:hypothetical protein